MALQKQLLSLPFTQGPDTKTDPILSAKPSLVENYVIRGGTLKKRWGTTTLASAVDTFQVPVGELLFSFDSELVRIGAGACESLGPIKAAWTAKAGGGQTATHSIRRIVRNTRTQKEPDHAYASGVVVTAWVESSGPATGLHIAVYDEATGDFYQTGASAVSGQTATDLHGCRCVVLGNKVLVFFMRTSTTALHVAIVNCLSPATAPTVVTNLQTDVAAAANGNIFDAAPGPGSTYAVVAYTTQPAGVFHLNVFGVSATGAVLASPAKADLGASGATNQSVALRLDSNGIGYAINYGDTATFTSFSGTTFAAVSSFTSITGTAGRVIAALVESSSGKMTVFLSGDGNNQPTFFVGSAVIDKNGVTTAYAAINGTAGAGICSDGFLFTPLGQTISSTGASVMVTTGTMIAGFAGVQPTTWALTVGGNVAAKMLPATTGGNSGVWQKYPRPFTTTNGSISVVVRERGRLNYTSVSGVKQDRTPIGLARVDLRPALANQLPVVQIGDAVYIGGSRPSMYDGQQWTDSGFNIFPEGVTAAAAGGGALSAGTYQYRVIYSWVSSRGELQRSAPSPAVSVTVTATQKVTLTVPTMRLSARDTAGVNQVQIEAYRTEANGTNFYRVTPVDAPTMNDQTASTVTITDDTVTDAALISNELLYTTGGVYDNIAPPAYTAACAHKSRLVMVGLEDPYEFRTSCVAIRGEMLRFNEAWGGRVPSDKGKLIGCASLDNNLILFAERGAYVVLGDGPDLLGNNPWLPPQPITAVTAGPLTAQSIVSTPAGVLFQNAQGFQLLDRSLNVQYIGADVEAYAGYTVRAAMVRPETSQIWMLADLGSDIPGALIGGEWVTSNGGVCLVFDYVYGQWSVLTNYGGQSLAYYQGKVCRVRSDGTVFQEQPGTYRDSGTYVPGSIETNWIKVAGIQGFQRVYEAGLLGAYGGPGNDFSLTWAVGFDYATTYDSTYASSYSTVGVFASGEAFQVQRQMPKQKCEAIRFKITDSPSGNGQGMSLTDLTLVVGVKGGSNRLPFTKTL